MITTPLTYAAELEQSATVTALLDAYPRWESRAAVDALYVRFGRPGLDLANELENDIYELENDIPADFVVFH